VLLGERLDLGELAREQGASRASIHRWFGTRETILDGILGDIAAEIAARAGSDARGEGDERACDFTRRLIALTYALPAMTALVENEPEVAMRLALRRTGAIHRSVSAALTDLLREVRPPSRVPAAEKIDLIVQAATGLVWASQMIGEGPRPEEAVATVRALLADDAG